MGARQSLRQDGSQSAASPKPPPEGLVKLTREPCELEERHAGKYESESLVIEVGNSKVRFRPVVYFPGRSEWSFLLRAGGVQTAPVNEDSFADILKDLFAE